MDPNLLYGTSLATCVLILRRQTPQERSDVWYGHDEKALAEKDDERGDPLAKPAFESSDRLRTFDVMLRQDSIYRCVESIHTGASTEFSRRSNVIGAVGMKLQSPVTAIVITLKIFAYRSTKQLLGDNYRHINRPRNLQTQQRHLDRKAQKQICK